MTTRTQQQTEMLGQLIKTAKKLVASPSPLYLEREGVVQGAQSWCNTPFKHDCEVKGAGCDCAHLITGVYHPLGYMPKIQFPTYGADWFRHATDENQYIVETALKYFTEITEAEAQMGDWFVLYFGRAWSHCGILVGSHRAVCAWPSNGRVTEINMREDRLVSRHRRRYFSPKWRSHA
jgi:cell wall-associated NlpC family hydrolase